ncbi:MAG: YbbR-like domain-containing protein [Enterococcus sp.]
MISKKTLSNLMYGLLALVFSLILFFNANGEGIQQTIMGGTEYFEETATEVVIHPTYDSDEYYIHGFEPTVSVDLRSANRVQLNAELNQDTRTFRVVADLSGLSEGTHEVALETQNLSNAVTATIEPATITVTIEKKVTQEFDVQPLMKDSTLADGYEVAGTTVKPDSVEITTGEETLAEIDRVVAQVEPESDVTADYSQEVAVQALDAAGNPLSIVSTPSNVQVAVDVATPEKNVAIFTTQEGNLPEGVSGYTFTLSDTTGVLSGPESALGDITSLSVPVNITGITRETTKEIAVPVPSGLALAPDTVTVTIQPTYIAETSETTSEDEESESSTEEIRESSSETSEATVDSERTIPTSSFYQTQGQSRSEASVAASENESLPSTTSETPPSTSETEGEETAESATTESTETTTISSE